MELDDFCAVVSMSCACKLVCTGKIAPLKIAFGIRIANAMGNLLVTGLNETNILGSSFFTVVSPV